MKPRIPKTKFPISIVLTLFLAACGTFDHLPFMGDKQADAGQPRDAVRYDCKSGKRFYVRRLDKENALWVIYPDREVRFEKATDKSAQTYSNGSALLELNGNQASITDGTDVSFVSCKAAAT